MASDSAHEDDFHGVEMEESPAGNPCDFVNQEVGAGTGAPINKTLTSQGNVIIIEPNSRELLRNPIEIAEVVSASPLGKFNPSVRTNKKRNLIIAEFNGITTNEIKELVNLTNLGKWKVRCSQPKSDIVKYGVIYPIAIETNVDSLINFIQVRLSDSPGNDVKVCSADRLKKRTENGWIDSTCIKIGFEGTSLPAAVSICHSYYRVKPFVYNSMQCYNCNRFGHTAGSCKAKARCLICGGNHSRHDCPEIGKNNYKCANCQGPHPANSKQCKYMQQARKIESIRAYEGKSYVEARNTILKQNKNNSNIAPANLT